jgi:23S rRNA (cytidine1920-2'-O)/16S rRNA (cytidine1409-2'-O)-methyltransferase
VSKKRIDVLLVEKGLAPSRERAQALILSGNVLVNDVPVDKPGTTVAEGTEVRIRGEDHPYVSRGGVKLAGALDHFKIEVNKRVALDVGASTGGFTHVMLLRGADKVFALDVGHNQMDWKIRNDPRVVVIEKVNARDMAFEIIGTKVDLITVDVSFISLKKILPALIQFSKTDTDWITLIKPQFEVGKEKVGKGGIVKSETDHAEVLREMTEWSETIGLQSLGLIESPIKGTTGNKEFLAYWKLKS